MALTTAAKVRTRLNIETFQATDTTIADFIADADGLIQHTLGSLPTAGDSDYALAVSVSTGLAAYYTGTQIPYPENAEEATSWFNKLGSIYSIANKNLTVLGGTDFPIPVAKSTTED
jgi:hypothetical protein